MKPVTLKYAVWGSALTAFGLSTMLMGCGGTDTGGSSVPVGTTAKSTALPIVCSNDTKTARFQVKDLGAGFSPGAANASGQIIGYMLVSGKTRVTLAQNGTTTDLGLDKSLPVTINNAGQVTGNIQQLHSQGFVWQNGKTTLLKNLPGGTDNYVSDMNNKGEIVGSANTGQKNISGQDIYHAVYWANASSAPQDLGVLTQGDDQSGAASINDQGQLVGFSGMVLGKADYIYMASHTSQMQDLGLLAAESGSNFYSQLDSIFIGNSGLIVGTTFLNGSIDDQVFLMHLGSQPTYQATLRIASKPNAADQFVATTRTNGFALYETGKGAQDLMAQLPSSCSITLQTPVAISDAGQIVASGRVNSAAHGFLITP